MVTTNVIENWTGDKTVKGPELAMRMFQHAQSFGGEYKYGEVKNVISHGDEDKELVLADGTSIKARSIIIATGMIERVPTTVEGIQEFNHKGVSYCAICDGPLYKGEDTAVIGGGNSAMEEGIYLASVAKSVTIFVRKPEEILAEKKIVEEAKSKDNINIVFGEIKKLIGEDKLEKLMLLLMAKKKLLKYQLYSLISDSTQYHHLLMD